MKLLLIITILLLPIRSFAQGAEWKWATGGFIIDHPYSFKTIIAANGDLVVVGSFMNTFTNGTINLQSRGLQDVFLARYNSNGQLLWAKSGGGHSEDWGYGVAEDKDENLYITGYFTDTAVFGNMTLISRDTAKSRPCCANDIFFAKYDKAGNFIWVKQAGGILRDRALTIASDRAGYLYIAGEFGSSANPPLFGNATFDTTVLHSHGESGMFLAKYDTSGRLVWVKNAGGRFGGEVLGIAIDKHSDIHITGIFLPPYAYFDSIKLYTASGGYGIYDMFVAKYDSSGNALWASGAGGEQVTMGCAIAVDNTGNSYVTGLIENMITHFGNGYDLPGWTSFDNAYIAKYSPSGVLLWAKNAGVNTDDNNFCQGGIVTDKQSNIYITGTFSNDSYFGGGAFQSYGYRDIMVCKYDNSGNPKWFKNAGSNSADNGDDLVIDSMGNIFVTGTIGGPIAQFDSHYLNNSSGMFNMFLAKLAPYPNSVDPFSIKEAEVYTYPNPSSGSFTLIYGTAAFQKLIISTVTGTILYQQTLESGRSSVNVSLPDLPDGIYFLTLTQKNGTWVKKIAIQH